MGSALRTLAARLRLAVFAFSRFELIPIEKSHCQYWFGICRWVHAKQSRAAVTPLPESDMRILWYGLEFEKKT